MLTRDEKRIAEMGKSQMKSGWDAWSEMMGRALTRITVVGGIAVGGIYLLSNGSITNNSNSGALKSSWTATSVAAEDVIIYDGMKIDKFLEFINTQSAEQKVAIFSESHGGVLEKIVRNERPDAAMALVKTLSAEQQVRLFTTETVALSWIADSDQADETLAMLAAMTAGQRTAVLKEGGFANRQEGRGNAGKLLAMIDTLDSSQQTAVLPITIIQFDRPENVRQALSLVNELSHNEQMTVFSNSTLQFHLKEMNMLPTSQVYSF